MSFFKNLSIVGRLRLMAVNITLAVLALLTCPLPAFKSEVASSNPYPRLNGVPALPVKR